MTLPRSKIEFSFLLSINFGAISTRSTGALADSAIR